MKPRTKEEIAKAAVGVQQRVKLAKDLYFSGVCVACEFVNENSWVRYWKATLRAPNGNERTFSLSSIAYEYER